MAAPARSGVSIDTVCGRVERRLEGCLPPTVTTAKTIVVVREGVEDDDTEGVAVAGIAAKGRA